MTDQTTPVTDDDRLAHEWANDVVRRPDFHEDWDQPIARAIKAHVPAPPQSIAEQIRRLPDYTLDGDHCLNDCHEHAGTLADYVEALEKNREEWRDSCHEVLRICEGHVAAIDHRDKYAKKVKAERDEAKKEVERLNSVAEDYSRRAVNALIERDEARTELQAVADILHCGPDQLLTDVARKYVEELDEWAQANHDAEDAPTLTDLADALRGRPVRTDPPAPSDVPEGQAWAILLDGNERTVGFSANGAGWIVYRYYRGLALAVGDERVTLLHRLVPETDAPDQDHLNHLIEPASVPTAQPWLVRDDQGLCLGVRQDPGGPFPPWMLLRLSGGTVRRRADADVSLVRPIDIDGLDINEVA